MSKRNKSNAALPRRLPRDLARRIMERLATSEEPLVVTHQNGVPTRIFDYSSYEKKRDTMRKAKPWEHRKTKLQLPDPLGAVDAEPPRGLDRRNLYGDK